MKVMYGKDNRTNSFLRIEQAIFYSFYLKINALLVLDMDYLFLMKETWKRPWKSVCFSKDVC